MSPYKSSFVILISLVGLYHTDVDYICGKSKSEAIDCMAKPEESLSGFTTLSDHAGKYRLTFVEMVGNSSKRFVTGSLTLQPQIPDLDSLNSVSTPLYGYTDLDLKSVGAYRVGNPGSRDPRAPGVLVMESDRNSKRVISMRIGSEANRRHAVRYDGAYTVLNVHRIDKDAFFGSWRSGLRITRSMGYFCAKLLTGTKGNSD